VWLELAAEFFLQELYFLNNGKNSICRRKKINYRDIG
jgi:hypothetical protein